jgi:alginate O-acetyltransferase complex protein AlgI
MVFSSFVFIFLFLPVTIVGFWLLSGLSHRLSRIWLCLTSLFFYGWWDIEWVPVLLFSVTFNYLIGHAIISRARADRSTGGLLFAGVLTNLGALIYYKYLFYVIQFFGAESLMPMPTGLPLGISFFTFTQIAFLVDVSQGFRERYSPINYLLFVTFFPHLIAGPIVHHRDLMPQFEDDKNYRFQPAEFAVGLAIFSMGLAKKTLIADNVAKVADQILDLGHVSTHIAWVGVLAYSMQLYFDFSGYSDMAIGLARLFGIKFPINFASPYKSLSIIDFWQRWHITLTRFLTSYLYNPIALRLVRRRATAGQSTSKRASQTVSGFLELIALPTFITMLIAGIWHGVGLQFVVFGALHGFYISVNHAWRTFGPKKSGRLPQFAKTIASGALVYLCVIIAQIFFRAHSMGDAIAVLSDMFFVHAIAERSCWTGLVTCAQSISLPSLPSPQPEVSALDLLVVAGSMAIAWFAPNTQQIMVNYDPVLDLGRRIEGSYIKAQLSSGWAVAFGVILFLGLFNIRDGQPFIYFQF